MGTADKVEVMFLKKLSDLVSPESVRNSPVVLSPALDVLIRVGPQKIAQKSLIGNIKRPSNVPDLIQVLQIGRQSSVHAQNLLVYESRDGESVEALGESLPNADVESPLALVVESVYTVDRGTFVVSPEKKEILLVLDLVREKKANGLYALLTTVHIVPEEQIVRFWRETTVLEQSQEVRVLTVNISCETTVNQQYNFE